MSADFPSTSLTIEQAIELLSGLSPENFYKIEAIIETEARRSTEQSVFDETAEGR